MTKPFDSGVFDAEVFDASAVRGDPGRRVVLCEITPSIRLRSWTVVPTDGAFDSGVFDDGAFDAGSGSGAAYYVVLERMLTAGDAALYRRAVGVRQNSTDLAEVASVAAVEATAGSWFWDEAAGLLYARVTSGSPDDYVLQAFVTYYFASEGVVINRLTGDADSGIYYQPWMMGMPGLTRQASGLLFGITVVSSGDLSLTNGHGAWHALIPGHAWKNKRVRILTLEYADGAAVPDRADATAIMTMLVEDVAANEAEATIRLGSIHRILDKYLPPGRFTRADYPNLGEGVEGTPKRLGWGRATIRPDLTDTSGSGEYTVADADYQTLFSVESVVAIARADGTRTTLTETLHYSVDLTACTVLLTGTDGYNAASYDLECDVIGKPSASDPSAYLKRFGEITRDILQAHLGVQDADLDVDTFDQVDQDEEAELSVWLKTPRTVASIFASSEPNGPSLERSVLGSVRQTADGRWAVLIWSYGAPDSGVALTRADFISFLPEPKIESVSSTARVYYNQNQSDGSWATAAAEDVATRYLAETFDEAEFYTFLRDASAAADLANRALLLVSAASVEVEFELRGAALADVLAGDFVTVTYAPAPVAGQGFSAAALEVQRLDLALSPVLQITGRLADTRAVGSRIGHVTDDTGVEWALADESARAAQGFVCDDAGLIDPADATTENLSIVW